MDDLTGKVALVTGASRGIGRAITLALAGAGADLAVNYRSRVSEAFEVISEIKKLGRRAIAVKGDVSVSADVYNIAVTVGKELGPPVILVNNAGIGMMRTVDNISERDWNETIAVNLTSAFLMIQTVLPGMRSLKWGRIINISSVAAQVGGVVGPHYAASKAGILGLTHYYAAYLAKEGITVNSIAPGPITTEMAAGIPELKPDLVPVGRFGTPEEIADVVLMIVRNGYITGQTVNVNGGRYLN
ncbi:MAG TPA: SDR family NAD(P)-dependent oxidoreductase [Dissulfurispiraceae bacterium]|nr:SDR family NAD(P)-dependent oxidoreductase [Dissulfurispiraceae bacterium]